VSPTCSIRAKGLYYLHQRGENNMTENELMIATAIKLITIWGPILLAGGGIGALYAKFSE
jgi:hypothetical protein